jgi:AAA+ superfamily predicted ATPase
MFGPLGTGKTLMACAVANKTDTFFFLITRPGVTGEVAGGGTGNPREAFEGVGKNLPAIIIISELDYRFQA